jgi:5-methylcytosine-specific restriction endonuclease McrA
LMDDQLLEALSAIVGMGNQVTADLLAHLAEVDERQLYAELGFPSLWTYCVESLGLCESSAGRRIAAARVCRQFPEGFALVANGDLHISALCLLKQHVNRENATELFELCRGKSARRVDELLAARFPKPDVRDSIRRLPMQRAAAPDAGSDANSAQILEDTTTQHPPETPLENAPDSLCAAPGDSQTARMLRPPSRAAAGRIEPLSADRFGVHFTADAEFRELLERVRGLAGHRLPSGDLKTLMQRGLEAYERELEKARFAVGRKLRTTKRAATKPNSPTPTTSARACARPLKRGRHVPAAVAREVYRRDGRQCTFVSKDGRSCGSRRFLELDHVVPWAVGGEPTVENLQVRCAAHNRHAARRYFGRGYMRAVAMKRSRREQPDARAGDAR